MHKTITLSFAIILAAFFPASTFAGPDYDESTILDAGSTVSAAAAVAGSGPLSTITGKLEGAPLPLAVGPAGDFEDVYMFQIRDPVIFSASTVPTMSGFADFNTELFLFDASGRGVLGNDDTNGNLGSTLLNAANDGSGAMVTQPGVYFLAITGSNNNPTGGGEPIFNQEDPNEISGPDGGPGGMINNNPQEGWDNTGGGEVGDYTIALTGAGFLEPIPTVSEWGLIIMVLLLMTAGTILFGRRRLVLAA
ncbi:MAG: IPTL-CTERM sorting domain-containing protein [Phycisphaerales bacterium]|nr:IPTL-CTERM sorting domain-containing protein [Phycisphaerales bacterium]